LICCATKDDQRHRQGSLREEHRRRAHDIRREGQKKIIGDALNGQRICEIENWQPRYMEFPMKAYTKRGGIDAIAAWKKIKRHYE